jgi:hypothetical protein
VRASTFSLSGHPEIDIQEARIVFTIEFPDDSADSQQLKMQIDRNIRSLADAVGHLKNDVANHNAAVEREVKEALERKR